MVIIDKWMESKRRVLPITVGEINDKNINILRKVNFDTLPVKYSTGLYMKIATQYTDFSRLAFYNDIVIGAYTIRLEDYKNQLHAYILTFVVLEPYRKYGIGKQMMAQLEKDLAEKSKVVGIYLHMHVLNQIGQKFYQACGFEVAERLDNYYTDLEEPHCLILRKEVVRAINEEEPKA
jgi:N-alpha-acetyltransferase 50